jgi:two-component system, chemotaxis family, chemotaxis protein CheY
MTSDAHQTSPLTDERNEATPPRLLVIDDDNVHRMVICKIGAKAGYEVFGAASYDEAARRFLERRYDCVTLDLSLGQRDGVEVLRDLVQGGFEEPIIIISGATDAITAETVKIGKSLNLNVRDPIPKPVNLAVLRQSLIDIKAQIGLRRLARLPA